MFGNFSKQFERASAASAAASFTCANLSAIMDATLLASILFVLIVLGLHILGILVVLVSLISILRIMENNSKQPESLA